MTTPINKTVVQYQLIQFILPARTVTLFNVRPFLRAKLWIQFVPHKQRTWQCLFYI